jgi:hypothetical protein
MSEFTVIMGSKWTPFAKCQKCGKRKLSVHCLDMNDAGLNAYILVHSCRRCLKTAKIRAKALNTRSAGGRAAG